MPARTVGNWCHNKSCIVTTPKKFKLTFDSFIKNIFIFISQTHMKILMLSQSHFFLLNITVTYI